jgi:hypothetical protein
VAQRVAEELTNALILPINPSPPATAANRRAGTVSSIDEAYDVVNRAITVGGFRNVMIIDESTEAGGATLESLANKLDLD